MTTEIEQMMSELWKKWQILKTTLLNYLLKWKPKKKKRTISHPRAISNIHMPLQCGTVLIAIYFMLHSFLRSAILISADRAVGVHGRSICFWLREQNISYNSISQSLIGVTGGLQYGAFRINTSASWMWEQYFAQKEIDRADGFITYQYDELAAMSGVIWENTWTYSPDDMDFGVQASVGFPFQVNGERDMGQAFKDSWQVGTRLSLSVFSTWLHTHRLSSHSIQRVHIGSGILF